jgi:DNA repair photolyase
MNKLLNIFLIFAVLILNTNTVMSKIYEPGGRAREYSPLAFNYFRGCTHGCKYCYVPNMFTRYNPLYCHSNCFPSLNVKELELSAKSLAGCGKQILLSFTGDPYCGVSPETTTKVLEILLKYNHKVAILTKGGKRCLNDLSVFKAFGRNIKVGATLTLFNFREFILSRSVKSFPI